MSCHVHQALILKVPVFTNRSIVIYLAGIFRGGTVHPVEAQYFTPVSTCSSGFSSFTGIVCSGKYADGEVIHCIFNQDFQLGLVCVEWRQTLAGRCPQYLEEHKAVGSFPCTGGELCPKAFFPSHEVHKYPACLNKSLYITEPNVTVDSVLDDSATTPADTTKQPSTCIDCGDGGSTGSTNCTETTTKSTLPTDSNCDIVSESSKQSVSCAVPVTIAVIFGILVTLVSCLLMVWEYRRGKFLLGMIYKCLRNRCHDRVAKKDVEESHEGADKDHHQRDFMQMVRMMQMMQNIEQESHEGADVPMMEMMQIVEADTDVRPRNGSCRCSAADSPQGSQGGAAVQEGKAQGSPRLVDNFEEI